MERVAFLIEGTGERIPCMLNPASVLVRRAAGLRPRSAASGPLTRTSLADDPLFFTGGGTTEIRLKLMFDLSLTSSADQVADVRDLTRPLFELSQGRTVGAAEPGLPPVRLIWGKSWNLLGVVSAVSERLEYFTVDGAPQRSWMSLRMLRLPEPTPQGDSLVEPAPPFSMLSSAEDGFAKEAGLYALPGEESSGTDKGSSTERLDQVAWQRYGNASWWKVVAAFNNIDDPFNMKPGMTLRLPGENG